MRKTRCWFLVAAALAIGGCGSSDSGAVETVVVTETAREAPTNAENETTGGDEEAVIPDVVGERLDVAESELDDLGIAYEEIGGGTLGVINASAWTVCGQRPGAGERGSTVKLIVARPGDCRGADTADTPAGSDASIPNLVGMRLDVAESELEDLGVAYEEIGGGAFGILDRSAWEVCEQRPAPGEPAQVVKLIVDRPGSC